MPDEAHTLRSKQLRITVLQSSHRVQWQYSSLQEGSSSKMSGACREATSSEYKPGTNPLSGPNALCKLATPHWTWHRLGVGCNLKDVLAWHPAQTSASLSTILLNDVP